MVKGIEGRSYICPGRTLVSIGYPFLSWTVLEELYEALAFPLTVLAFVVAALAFAPPAWGWASRGFGCSHGPGRFLHGWYFKQHCVLLLF